MFYPYLSDLKRDFRQLKAFSGKIFQMTGLCGKMKANPIGAQCLVSVGKPLILPCRAVFQISGQRMPEMSHLCADLVSASGVQIDLQEAQTAVLPPLQYGVFGDCGQSARDRRVVYTHDFLLFVLAHKGFANDVRGGGNAENKAPV